MMSLLRVLAGLALPFLVLACTGESKVMKPVGSQSSGVETLNEINSNPRLLCNKSEEELSFSDEAQKNLFAVQETIPVQDYIYYRCDGSIKKGKGDRHPLQKKIEIPTTLELRRTRKLVGFVEILNHSNCDITRIATSSREVSLPGYEKYFSFLSKTGSLKLVLNNDGYRGFGNFDQLGVLDGRNLIEIRYFGECRKYKETPDGKDSKYTNPSKCLEAEKIATRWMTLDVQIDRPEIEGLQEVREKQCDLNKKLEDLLGKFNSERQN